jgi:hypothetical protein
VLERSQYLAAAALAFAVGIMLLGLAFLVAPATPLS